MELVWLIPLLPLAGFIALVLGGRLLGEPGAGWLATGAIGSSFLVTLGVFADMVSKDEEERSHTETLFEWIPAGDFSVDIGFLADPLSITMALFVTGVGTLIHLYSIGYMHGDPNFSKFFLYLNLFASAMLMLVLGDNLLLTFLGWEGVGACSYFLISFWFGKDANASAGKKAFVTNRIGDWGFMVGIFLTFLTFGTINYTQLTDGAVSGAAQSTVTAIALLFFVGAIGKSAQLPLFVWLPDAMAGPTPVSALIHAATMVTSGVYLLVRLNPFLAGAYEWAPTIIAWVGAATALFAATIAVAQNDIKKVLAYSTVSQLGYMFLAVGVGGYVPAIFHMITHAFFKALLFLGSGSVIHGMGDEQDMRRMGGLRKVMPITAATFIIGWLAIAGVPPFAGFWSKDEILVFAYNESVALYAVGLVTALLTAFYMSRQVFMTFFGEPRWNDPEIAAIVAADNATADDNTDADGMAVAHALSDEADAETGDDHAEHADHGHHGDEIHPHESPWTMTLPLVVLALLAVVAGAMQLPFSKDLHFLEDWLHPVVHSNEAELGFKGGTKWILAAIAIAAGVIGIASAVAVYLRRPFNAKGVEPTILKKGWGFDAGIAAFMGGPGRMFFDALAWFDRTVVDGIVNGVASLTRGIGGGMRTTQSGYIRNYALGLSIGVVVVVAFLVSRATF
jgi:NADH-quinone oxidoreductase subunit L